MISQTSYRRLLQNPLDIFREGGYNKLVKQNSHGSREGSMQGEHSSQSSFFGMIYEELIPADYLLRKLTVAGAQELHIASGFWGNAPLKWAVYDLDHRVTVAHGEGQGIRFTAGTSVSYMIKVTCGK